MGSWHESGILGPKVVYTNKTSGRVPYTKFKKHWKRQRECRSNGKKGKFYTFILQGLRDRNNQVLKLKFYFVEVIN